MLLPIKLNSTDIVTPLFDMQHRETIRNYRKIIRCQLQNESGLYPISELVSFLQWATRTHFFDRNQAADIYRSVGRQFGFIHGGVLTHEKTIRSHVVTLVAFDDNQDAIRGYKARRQYLFYEATPDERTITDDQLIERLHELTEEAPARHDPEGVWFFYGGVSAWGIERTPLPTGRSGAAAMASGRGGVYERVPCSSIRPGEPGTAH